VPIAAEALKKMGVYDKRKIMGVTTLDVVGAVHMQSWGLLALVPLKLSSTVIL
jgi:hypothetical protein